MVITGAPSCRLRVPFGYPQDEFLSAPHTVDANQDAQDAPADGYCNKQRAIWSTKYEIVGLWYQIKSYPTHLMYLRLECSHKLAKLLKYYNEMVGGLEHGFYFPFHTWDAILLIDELIFFKMVF